MNLFESALIDDNFQEIEVKYKNNFLIHFEKDDNIMKIFRVFNSLYNLSKEQPTDRKVISIDMTISGWSQRFRNNSYEWSFYNLEEWAKKQDNHEKLLDYFYKMEQYL